MPVSIHPPRVGRDRCNNHARFCLSVSIHPPRVGRDDQQKYRVLADKLFQSTLPVWGGTSARHLDGTYQGVSIHPPRVGRDALFTRAGYTKQVSIHPPRVGRDADLV